MGSIFLVVEAFSILGTSDILADAVRPFTTKLAAKVVAWVKEG